MAVVVNQAIELYSILKTFREVKADPGLSPTHKLWMAKDLKKSLPARAMCGQCGSTYDIILSMITSEVEDMTDAAVAPAAVRSVEPVATSVEAKEKPAKEKAAKANPRRAKAPRSKK